MDGEPQVFDHIYALGRNSPSPRPASPDRWRCPRNYEARARPALSC